MHTEGEERYGGEANKNRTQENFQTLINKNETQKETSPSFKA